MKLKSFLRRELLALPLLAMPLSAYAGTPEGAPGTATTPATAQTGSTDWGTPIYDIPADPAVRFGRLPNGMKYAVMRNATPQNTVAVRMGYDVGWIDEMDSELGLAHFIEHMAFNGSTNVPEGEMVKLLEREGLAFGADTNASTSFEETIYKLDLPRNDPALIGTALMLMRETASELTLAPEAIDRERGILQSETRTRNSFMMRRIKDYFTFTGPNSRFAQRFRPEGTEQVVANAPAETIRGLYSRYYRPDNATLVVVGDIDPATIEAEIVSRFGNWAAPAAPIERVNKGQVDFKRKAAADIFVDPAVPYIITIDRLTPWEKRPETVAEFRDGLLAAIGTAILNRRFETIANSAEAPIISGQASGSDYFDIARQASLTIQAKEGEWQKALTVGEQEWRRAVEHGFGPAELAEQIANFELALRTAAEQAGTRRNVGLAEKILQTAADEDLFVTPQTAFDMFNRLKPELTVDAVNTVFRERFSLETEPLIHVSSKEDIAGGEKAILADYNASRATAVAAPEFGAAASFAYSDFGTPGTVVSDTVIADLGIRSVRFANNVMLNLKTTDFEDGKLRWQMRLGSGQLAMPRDRMAESLFFTVGSAGGGLGKHSFDQLQQILAGRNVAYGLQSGTDSTSASGTTTMADLPLQMQLTAAYVSDPGYRPESLTRWNALIPPFMAQIDATPQGVGQFQIPSIISSGDPRFGVPPESELKAVTIENVKQVMAAQLASAPIEISVVGDIDEAQVIAAVAASFGALPQREAKLSDTSAARKVSFRADKTPVTLYHRGAPDQGLIQVYWPTDDNTDQAETVTMSLLAQVMELKLLEKIREELGATYSPSAASDMSDTFTDFGSLSTTVIVTPEQSDEVFAAIDEIAASLRDKPVDDDLLNRARKPLLERIVLSRRENGYWLGVAGEAQLRPDKLDRVRKYEALLNAVTSAALQTAARKYLGADKELRISVMHESLKK